MLVFFKGILIGIANIIPGLSGGTMAVILGLYPTIIDSFTNLMSFKKDGFKDSFIFLFFLVLGALIGIVFFANILEFLLFNYKESTFFFFMGTVIASIPIVMRCHDDMTFSVGRLFTLFIFLTIPVLFFLLDPSLSNSILDVQLLSTQVYLFFSGLIAALAMVLPGISGSFILLVLGTYTTIINAIKSFDVLILFIFIVGIIFGVFFASNIVKYCLSKCPSLTYYAILGLVLGSLPSLWPGFSLSLAFINSFCFFVGVIFVLVFKKLN